MVNIKKSDPWGGGVSAYVRMSHKNIFHKTMEV